jgi:TonB-linked SusC/RagA family outer membrane protein
VTQLLAALALASPVLAQATREVTGKVTVAGVGTPLQDATIGVFGQPIGVRTNDKGEFRIRVPAGDVTLQVRAIGYKRSSARVPFSQASVDFALEKDVLQLEGVTITGAATTIEKKNAATAIAAVQAEELARVPATSLESALQGKVIGAQISMNNGAPGGGGQVQIRGASSLIGNIQPLFVVDGVIISNAVRSNRLQVVTGSLNSGEENGTNRLADINPNDIENIQVLKSAAASAIYGSQATNGVVVITTKRGKAGAPKFDVTQRVGTYTNLVSLGSRHFEDSTEVLNAIGNNPEGIAAVRTLCTPTCPYHDYVKELYDRADPSYETIVNLTGGLSNTRYFVSALHRSEKGDAANTGARRQSLRANVDQAIGSRITASISANVLRSFSQRGISNNDNALSSPVYGFAYTPGIMDLKKRDAQGNYPMNPFAGGGVLHGSNPFQTFALMVNNEDVYRGIISGRANLSAYTDAHNAVNITLSGGADRSSNENYIYAPQTLQFQLPGSTQGGSFPGTVIQGNGDNLLTDVSTTAVWNFNPGKWFTATTQAGLQYSGRELLDYNIVGRGLGPQQFIASGAANTSVTNNHQLVNNDAFYAQEEILAFNERLYLSGSIRGERSSVNGDPKKYYYFPRFSASYRFVNPIAHVDEVKLRASLGESGNQPGYGTRFLTIASQGLIAGDKGFGVPGAVGNPNIAPERLRETEYGIDATFLNQRLTFEATYYDRNITDLLVTPTLAPSTGLGSTTVNGGEMKTKGYELGLTLVPVQTRDFNWTSRATWYQNRADITKFPPGVLPFGVTGGGFGNQYGRLRFRTGHTVTTIYGAAVINDTTRVDIPVADANPKYLMSFSNDFNYKAFSFSILADLRHGGTVANMTLNLNDEGGTTWDYDEKSPDTNVGATLGEWRYNSWAGGANTRFYLEDGSYIKIRELSAAYDLPREWYSKVRGVQRARLSLSGRNLFIISPYNGYDPEVNNAGNVVSRFVDLAPWPPTRSFFLSLDLGF